MCREMLVLEEKELVCVEVKRKMEGGRLTKPGRECVAQKNVWICHRALARVIVHVSECEREKEGGGKGRARLLHAARGEAKSASPYKQCNHRPEQTIPSPGNTDQSGFKQSRLVPRASNWQPRP